MKSPVLVDRYAAWLIYCDSDSKRLEARNSETHESLSVPYEINKYNDVKEYLRYCILKTEQEV